MTELKPTRLPAPHDYMEVSVRKVTSARDATVWEWRVRVHDSDEGKSIWTSIEYEEARARAVLAAIRKHKAHVKREGAGA
jgi:hypothetical protein